MLLSLSTTTIRSSNWSLLVGKCVIKSKLVVCHTIRYRQGYSKSAGASVEDSTWHAWQVLNLTTTSHNTTQHHQSIRSEHMLFQPDGSSCYTHLTKSRIMSFLKQQLLDGRSSRRNLDLEINSSHLIQYTNKNPGGGYWIQILPSSSASLLFHCSPKAEVVAADTAAKPQHAPCNTPWALSGDCSSPP